MVLIGQLVAEAPRVKRFDAENLGFLPYNLGDFMRMLALPKYVEHWSLTTLRE